VQKQEKPARGGSCHGGTIPLWPVSLPSWAEEKGRLWLVWPLPLNFMGNGFVGKPPVTGPGKGAERKNSCSGGTSKIPRGAFSGTPNDCPGGGINKGGRAKAGVRAGGGRAGATGGKVVVPQGLWGPGSGFLFVPWAKTACGRLGLQIVLAGFLPGRKNRGFPRGIKKGGARRHNHPRPGAGQPGGA